MKRHCSCQWCVRPHSGNESIKKGWPFSLGWSENSPILDLKWEGCDVIPLALAYLLFYYLHQCISYLQRRLGCSSALHFIIDFGLSPWPSAASLSLTQTKGLRQFSCLSQFPYGHSGLCLRFLLSCGGLLCHGLLCAEILSIFIVSVHTRTCIYIFTCTLRSAVALFFASFCPVIRSYSLRLSVRLCHFVLLIWACQILLQK